ncbi:hypothetical protein OB953_00150 [Aeromonas salmonicida]|uniref:hypothetical protein n=1 Tax=Aeromonas salmonicida TaxID=645 RepID=UPI00259D947E|nr:hypothetical protein [Aeromonas salmonicida]MDM5100365.1 hypothetical protein [Aeromonas salmonicida]MDM5134023.1 hypothetical protein [Aeromonas salmonicida]HDN9019626.1 hypothetical protein [Aeromonas salmonicida]
MTSFYLRDTRTNVGSTCMFWALNGNGYTSNLDKAHIYTLEEAQSHFNDRHTDVPLSKALVDELCTVRVDHQYLDESQGGEVADGGEYVIHVSRGDYDGNDVYWKAERGCTANLSDALVLTKDEAEQAMRFLDDAVIYPFLYAVSISRRTFQARNVNERRMITAAGIRKPKRRRERPTTGRTRGNCPDCGKVTWGFIPHETYTCAEAAREKYGASHIDDCEDAARYSKARKEVA